MSKIKIKTKKEIELIRSAGALAAETLVRAGEMCKPGVNTLEIDEFIGDFTKKTRRHFCLPRLQWISALRLHQFEQRHLSRHSQKGNRSQGWRHFEHRHHDDSFRLPRRLFSHVLRRKRQSVGEGTCRCRQTLSGRGNSGGGNAKSSFFGHRLRHSAYRRRAWI